MLLHLLICLYTGFKMKEDCPRVAVLLAVYNGEKWLSEQIESILHQRRVNLSLFISIDESSDQSNQICADYEKRKYNIKVLPSKGRFGNAALNFFRMIRDVNFIDYDYIGLSDQDDIWLEDKIISGIDMMSLNNCDAYSSNLLAFDDEKAKQWIINKYHKQTDFDYLFQGASAGCTYILSKDAMVIVKKSLMNADFEVQSRPSHDWAIYAICRSHKLDWFFDEKSYILYRQHSNNFYGSGNPWQNTLKKISILRKKWYKKQILFLENLVVNNTQEKNIFYIIKNPTINGGLYLIVRSFCFRRRIFDKFMMPFIIIYLMMG